MYFSKHKKFVIYWAKALDPDWSVSIIGCTVLISDIILWTQIFVIMEGGIDDRITTIDRDISDHFCIINCFINSLTGSLFGLELPACISGGFFSEFLTVQTGCSLQVLISHLLAPCQHEEYYSWYDQNPSEKLGWTEFFGSVEE